MALFLRCQSRFRSPHCEFRFRCLSTAASFSAFSIIELLVSCAIIGLALAAIAGPWLVSSNANRVARVRNIQEAAIDDDIAVMEDLAYRYTCCPGTCTTNAATVAASATCKGLGGSGSPSVGTEYYYHPYYAPASSVVPNINSFDGVTDSSPRDAVYEDGLCHTGLLIAGLVTEMETAPSTTLQSIDVQRSVSASSADSHLISVTYAGTNLNRTIQILPAVAAFCP